MPEIDKLDLKEISSKVGLKTKEFTAIANVSPSAINQLKNSPNPVKYEVTNLGIMAKYLGLSYDDLVIMTNIKKSVKVSLEQESKDN